MKYQIIGSQGIDYIFAVLLPVVVSEGECVVAGGGGIVNGG